MHGMTINGRYPYAKSGTVTSPEKSGGDNAPLESGKPLGQFPKKETVPGSTVDARHPIVSETVVKPSEYGKPDPGGKGLESVGRAYGAKQDTSGQHIERPKTSVLPLAGSNQGEVRTTGSTAEERRRPVSAATKLYPKRRGLKGSLEGTD